MMSQLTSMANCDKITFAYGYEDYRGMSKQNFNRYLCCTKIKNTRIIVVVANSMSLFLIKLNFRTQIVILLITKLFLKHKELPLDVALGFALKDFEGIE